jgi:hypothetical protein
MKITTDRLFAVLLFFWMISVILFIALVVPANASGTAKKKTTHPGTKVQAYVKEEPKPKCLDPVRVVGSQDIREDAAEESAKKAWSEMVRWESGESFMDVNNATGYEKRCSRSSIGEALGQVLNRCEVIAKPCRPGLVKKGSGQ